MAATTRKKSCSWLSWANPFGLHFDYRKCLCRAQSRLACYSRNVSIFQAPTIDFLNQRRRNHGFVTYYDPATLVNGRPVIASTLFDFEYPCPVSQSVRLVGFIVDRSEETLKPRSSVDIKLKNGWTSLHLLACRWFMYRSGPKPYLYFFSTRQELFIEKHREAQLSNQGGPRQNRDDGYQRSLEFFLIVIPRPQCLFLIPSIVTRLHD